MTSQFPRESFRVTTQRVTVRVRLSQGAPLDGAFTCAAHRREGVGATELITLLNQPASFVPFFPNEHPKPILLNKSTIRWVELAVAAIEHDEFGEPRCIDLLLDDGEELSGEVEVSAPLGHTRTLDAVNEAGRFLALRTQTSVLLVNLAVVSIVAEAE